MLNIAVGVWHTLPMKNVWSVERKQKSTCKADIKDTNLDGYIYHGLHYGLTDGSRIMFSGGSRVRGDRLKEKEIRKRDIKLSDYNISTKKYRELLYFCMQYEEKKKELHSSYSLNSVTNDGMPRGNKISNTTEQKAIRNALLRHDIELIEQTAIEADSGICEQIIKNVTDGIPYEYMDVHMGRKQFYEARRYFFYLLAQKR